MNPLKKILFSLFSIFLIWQSIIIVRQLYFSTSSDFDGLSVLFVACLVNLYITGVFAFPGFVFPSSKLLPPSYYKIHRPRLLQDTYRLLGVRYFRYLLILLFWGRKNKQKQYFDGRKSGLTNLIYQSKQSEFGHFAAFIVVVITTGLMLLKSLFLLALVTFLINLIFNLYPVILQRMHRMRIDRIRKSYPSL